MAAPIPAPSSPSTAAPGLRGERIAFVGKLSGMTRPEATKLVIQHGAEVVDDDTSTTTLVVIGDSQPDLASAFESDKSGFFQLVEKVAAGAVQLVHESELWQRVGLVGEDADLRHGVHRLYTPAMLAELLNVPIAAVRRWHRRGALIACRSVRRLAYFDFSEVAVARHLAALYTAGCSLKVIDRKLAELHRALPDVQRPLSDPSIVVSGRRLYLRRGNDLAEPGGQLLIDFDKPLNEVTQELSHEDTTDSPSVLPISSVSTSMSTSMSISVGPCDESSNDTEGVRNSCQTDHSERLSTLEELQQTALEWEDLGELEQAAEAYRTMLVAGGPSAELHFALGDLLYRLGDWSAARERYYAAIELDEEYVEARANLGCVFAENGELELAVAAFQGALLFHPDYADVHYHLAIALDRLDRRDEAELHWHTFLALAPESPWAEMARTRLGPTQSEPVVLSDPLS